MIIKKTLIVMMLFTATYISNSSTLPAENNSNVIQDSSYYAYKNNHVVFYTFDGNEIETVEDNLDSQILEGMLDPEAKKPQPTSVKLRYSAEWPIPIKILGFTLLKLIKKPEMCYVIFSDKHDNQIAEYIYNTKEKRIKVSSPPSYEAFFFWDESNPKVIDKIFPLDLSQIQTTENTVASG